MRVYQEYYFIAPFHFKCINMTSSVIYFKLTDHRPDPITCLPGHASIFRFMIEYSTSKIVIKLKKYAIMTSKADRR